VAFSGEHIVYTWIFVLSICVDAILISEYVSILGLPLDTPWLLYQYAIRISEYVSKELLILLNGSGMSPLDTPWLWYQYVSKYEYLCGITQVLESMFCILLVAVLGLHVSFPISWKFLLLCGCFLDAFVV
jgi:hypothetical protein